MKRWLLVLLPVVLSVWFRSRYRPVIVRGHSMSDLLDDGQRVLIRRCRTALVGDLVVFGADPAMRLEGDSGYLIKQVAAISGDPRPAELAGWGLVDIVPGGHIAVLGASRSTGSLDSRTLGYIPTSRILGRVVLPRPRSVT